MGGIAAASIGCPSGLGPADSAATGADPRAFVQTIDTDRFRLELSVAGAKCAGCLSKIEGALRQLNGVENARLNLSTGRLSVDWRGALDPRTVTAMISSLGYGVAPFDPSTMQSSEDEYGRMLMRSLAVAGFATANIMLLSVGVWASTRGEMGESTRTFMHLVSGLIAIPAAAYAGRPFFMSAWQALQKGHANMDVPISLAVVLAVGASLYEALNHGVHAYFDAAVMLLFFLLIGRWLDHHLRTRARAAAQDLMALQSLSTSRIRRDGSVEAVSARDVCVGDKLYLAPGDRFPVNAIILSGQSDLDMSLVNGESLPRTEGTGASIPAGVINISHPLQVRAIATADKSLVADLVRLVEAGQQSRSRYVRLADKAARAYVPIVHTLALATFLGWYFFGGVGLRESVMTAVAVLIITCPCALGLATPAVQIVATGQLFRRGVLVRTGDALERLAKATDFFFDKTGTLTTGRLQWTNRAGLDAGTVDEVAALARTSRHPIARAIVGAVGGGPLADGSKETAGQGVTAHFQGRILKMGRWKYVSDTGVPPGLLVDGIVSTYFRRDQDAPLRLDFLDDIRPGAVDVVAALKREGVRVGMLSGDRSSVACAVGRRVGIDDVTADMSPMDKIEALSKCKSDGAVVAMVGDGLNDTAALAMADVSLSPGTAADAAQSAADFVFQGNSLRAVLSARIMARASQRRIIENFAFAALYNAVAAPLAMAGFVTPLVAALAMSGSSIIVTLNALRLTRTRLEPSQ